MLVTLLGRQVGPEQRRWQTRKGAGCMRRTAPQAAGSHVCVVAVEGVDKAYTVG